MADRWFVVPVATTDITDSNGNVVYTSVGPKYADAPGITGFSGQRMDFSADKWSDLPWYPDTMYVVRFYASKPKPLNDLEKNGDAWSERDVSDQEIASYLNDKLDKSLTYDEWQAHFSVG